MMHGGSDNQAHTDIVEMPQPLGLFAGDLFDRASENLEAFRVLAERDQELMHVKYYLLSHAMELFLKSYLAAHSVTKRELQSRELGHNLEKLLDRCELLGMPTVENLRHFILEINRMNGDYDFRYPTGYNLRVPSPKLCLDVMDPFEKLLSPIISKAQVCARVQWAYDTRHLKGKKVRWSD